MLSLFKKFGKLLGIFLFFFAILYFYIHNITRDVYSGDIGDLVTAAYVFGVPHPPGYPFLTFLGFLFTRLPLSIPPVAKMSLVSVLSAFFGTIIYFLFCLYIYKDYFSVDKGNKRVKSVKGLKEIGGIREVISVPWRVLLVCFLATGTLAFSYMYWLYAEVPEVFGLSNFFLILLYFLAYRFYMENRGGRGNRADKTNKKNMGMKYLYGVALVAGLSLTNQQAILCAFPGIAFMVLPGVWKFINISSLTNKKQTNRERFYLLLGKVKFIGGVFTTFLLGLLPYSYLFIAASTNPVVNWMGEPSINNFVRMLLRMDYTFAKDLISVTQRFVILGVYFSSLYHEFSIVVIALGVVGGLGIWRKDRYLFYTLVTAFFFAGPLFIFIIAPGINDPDDLGVLERFYMHSYILFLLFLPIGLFYLQQKIKLFFKREIYGLVFLVPLIIVLVQMFYFNNQKTDLSKTNIGNNFAYDILTPLPKNTLLFPIGDSATFNTWYVHYVLDFRSDVRLMGIFGDRSSFEKQIVEDYKRTNPETKIKDIEIVRSQLLKISKTRPIHSMYIFSVKSKEYIWMPVGLTYELTKRDAVPELAVYKKRVDDIVKKMHIPYRDSLDIAEQNNITPYTSRQYSYSIVSIGDFFYLRYGDRKNAYEYYKLAQEIDPYNSLPYAKIAILQGEDSKQCDKAVFNIDRSISMYHIYKPYYTFALRIYGKCGVGKGKIEVLKERYTELFGKDLEKDPHY